MYFSKISTKWCEVLKSRLKLSQILLSHNRLYDVCELIQDYFSLHLLMFSACVFVECTSHVYCIFDTLKTVWNRHEEGYDPRWPVFGLRFVYVAFRVYGHWWIVDPTTSLEKNVRHIKSKSIGNHSFLSKAAPFISQYILYSVAFSSSSLTKYFT